MRSSNRRSPLETRSVDASFVFHQPSVSVSMRSWSRSTFSLSAACSAGESEQRSARTNVCGAPFATWGTVKPSLPSRSSSFRPMTSGRMRSVHFPWRYSTKRPSSSFWGAGPRSVKTTLTSPVALSRRSMVNQRRMAVVPGGAAVTVVNRMRSLRSQVRTTGAPRTVRQLWSGSSTGVPASVRLMSTSPKAPMGLWSPSVW